MIELDAIVIGEGTEAGYFSVLPGASEGSIAFENPVDAISILKEDLTAGEKVTIIQTSGGYGVVRKTSELRGCLSVPDSTRSAIFLGNPANVAASYIGRLAGNTITPYRAGKVVGIVGSKLSIEYDSDSYYSDKQDLLSVAPIGGITYADFAVDDYVLINAFEYNQPMVVGWWTALLNWLIDRVKTCENDPFGSRFSVVALKKSGNVLYEEGYNPHYSNFDFASLRNIKKIALHPYFFAALDGDGKVTCTDTWYGSASFPEKVAAWPKIVDLAAWNYNLAGVGEDGIVYSTLGDPVDFGTKIKKVFVGGNGLFARTDTVFIDENNQGFIGVLSDAYNVSALFPIGAEVGFRYLERANVAYASTSSSKAIYVYTDGTKETLANLNYWQGENDIQDVIKVICAGVNGAPRAFLTRNGDVYWTDFNQPLIQKRFTDCADCYVHQWNTNGYGITLTAVKKDGTLESTDAYLDAYTWQWNLNS